MKNFKDSGIEWLGEIPQHWEVSKFKYFYRSNMGETILTQDLKDEGIPIYSATEDDKFFGKIKNPINILNINDFVIPARGNSIGAVKIVKEKSTCTQTTIFSKQFKEINPYYVYYFLLGYRKFLFEFIQTAIPQITIGQVNDNPILYPPLKEQEQIANFLDEKCEQIKNFIEKKEKLITLLKEQKQAFINEATTKGLDKNVNFKDSGIEYLGEIPQHWEVRKLKYITYVRNQKNNNIDFKIGLENIESKTGKYIPTSEMVFEKDGIEFKSGDILFGKLRPYLAKVFLANKNGICVSEFLVLKIKSENNKFIKFLMLSSLFIDIVDGSTYGTKMPRASWEFIGNLKIPLPPLKEQEQIANFLDEQCEKIDLLIEKTEKQIKLIKEYKTTLINQAVCGRIRKN
ncbi:restriction endonuclease subunit S [Campylobacter volucris]|uniref:restriction endonuclease subunit S n=1 Tax=Campylobacter volucris TaxID=1031542 RepID=UPI001059EBAD|nr:restriction endonuclease subunit S [Campylobacter volucris]TDJ86174.1 restriction endonuclease subunit S [Campylobacter volucris]